MPEHADYHEPHADHPGVPVPEPQIVHELSGPLRCVACRYELQGLSIKGNCPECGLPVRATLLSMVDPQAVELQPIGRPRLVAIGLVVWISCTVLALLLGLLVWASHTFADFLGDTLRARMVFAGAIALGMSGIGAMAIVRPHREIPGSKILRAAVTIALCPIAVKLYIELGRLHATGTGSSPLTVWTEGTGDMGWRVERLALWLTLALGGWFLRPNLRLLASRSLVLRSRRVDRQTIAAAIAALLIAALGDALALGARLLGDQGVSLLLLGDVLVGLGVVLLTLGVIGVARDTMRLLPAVLQPPLAIEDVLEPAPAGPAHD